MMRRSLDPDEHETLRRNLDGVRGRISEALRASHRAPDAVTLVVVTKAAPLEIVRGLEALGVTDIGESRIQQARLRHEQLGESYHWHLIGHLQRNKVGPAVEIADLIHSVDSERLLEALDRRASSRNVRKDVLLEVNVSGEASKHGFRPEDAADALARAAGCSALRVTGLMAMAPRVEGEERARPFFAALRELRDELERVASTPLPHLSMGMSQDYRVAVEEGATHVRVGSAIFRGVSAPVAGEG
jgi:pyridoxal phosphate enzyme (YggS family)